MALVDRPERDPGGGVEVPPEVVDAELTAGIDEFTGATELGPFEVMLKGP